MSSTLRPAYDLNAASQVRAALNKKTMPLGALGRLEELAESLAGMTGKCGPAFPSKAVLVAAADHGVAAQGVSAYPPEVTAQMVLNFLGGGAGINVLARQAGAKVLVVDAGVNAEPFEAHPSFLDLRVGRGTADMSRGPAMRPEQARACLDAGRKAVDQLVADGLDILATGDMGIGNTTASTAIAAALLQRPLEELTGRGTGLSVELWKKKMSVIQAALDLNRPDPKDPLDVLAKVGGFEIGLLAGAMLEASRRRIPVLIDGFISGAAALLAASLEPECRNFMIASHQSVEIGHRHILERLGLRPYLNLELRLGEGTGAALCFHLVDAACLILKEMATFESAGVTDKA